MYDSTSRATYPIINPSTGDKICDVAMGNKEVVDFAVAAARKALQPGSPWHTMTASQRGNLLNKLADLIERDSEYLTHLETMNSGRVCSKDLPRVIKYYWDFAQTMSQNTHEPVGIEGHIISGDFPLLRQAWVLGSALCRGNTVILKPAEQTPLSSLYVASLTAEAGFPLVWLALSLVLGPLWVMPWQPTLISSSQVTLRCASSLLILTSMMSSRRASLELTSM